jgi:hypothetical protein
VQALGCLTQILPLRDNLLIVYFTSDELVILLFLELIISIPEAFESICGKARTVGISI